MVANIKAAYAESMEQKVDALVLRTADYGENDKIVTLFSLQKGKISASLKGVKKAGAKLKFAAQPFCFAEYVLTGKGERNTVISAALTDGFYPLREDIGKFYAAACVLGVCDTLLFDGIVNEELFLRTVNTLKEMCVSDEADALVSFMISALGLSGYGLALEHCGGCGKELSGRMFFDLRDGCFYCSDCAKGSGASESTLHELRKGAGMSYDESLAKSGKMRAIRLLSAYFTEKTETRVKAFDEYIPLLSQETRSDENSKDTV